MSQPETPPIRVITVSPQDQSALTEFYRQAWGVSGAAAETVAVAPRENCPFPLETRWPVVAVYVGDRIVAHLGSIPTRFWDGSGEIPGHWLKGLMVLEEYRNGPLGYLLVKEMMKEVALAGVMTVAPPARRLFQACGFEDLGAAPNYLSAIHPARLLRAIDPVAMGLDSLSPALRRALRAARRPPLRWAAAGLTSAGLAAQDGVNRLRARGLRSLIAARLPEAPEIDALWARLRQRVALAPDRSGAYFQWRYARGAAGQYAFIEVRRRDHLVGLLVVRPPRRTEDPRLSGLRVGLIVDLVLDPADEAATTAGLLAARRWARHAGCDALLFTISHQDFGRGLPGRGFFRLPGNVHFMLRRPPALGNVLEGGLSRSWLTRGDAWGDDI